MPLRQEMVPMFYTTDGKGFAEEAAALRHQAELDNDNEIDMYLMSKDVSTRTRVTCKHHILGYIAFTQRTIVEDTGEA